MLSTSESWTGESPIDCTIDWEWLKDFQDKQVPFEISVQNPDWVVSDIEKRVRDKRILDNVRELSVQRNPELWAEPGKMKKDGTPSSNDLTNIRKYGLYPPTAKQITNL